MNNPNIDISVSEASISIPPYLRIFPAHLTGIALDLAQCQYLTVGIGSTVAVQK